MKFRLRLFLVAMLLSVGVCAAVAQDSKREAQLRTVRGVVVDKSSEVGIASAVVFLKNVRTNAVRSYIADDEAITASAVSTPMSTTKSTPKRMAQNRPPARSPVSTTRKSLCIP